jgi:hypothetical protein
MRGNKPNPHQEVRLTTQSNNGNGKGHDLDPDEVTIIRPSPVHPDIAIETDLKGNTTDQVDMPEEIKPDDPDENQN